MLKNCCTHIDVTTCHKCHILPTIFPIDRPSVGKEIRISQELSVSMRAVLFDLKFLKCTRENGGSTVVKTFKKPGYNLYTCTMKTIT